MSVFSQRLAGTVLDAGAGDGLSGVRALCLMLMLGGLPARLRSSRCVPSGAALARLCVAAARQRHCVLLLLQCTHFFFAGTAFAAPLLLLLLLPPPPLRSPQQLLRVACCCTWLKFPSGGRSR